MISRRRAERRSIGRCLRAAVLGGAALALGASLVLPRPALADPALTVEEARAQIAQLQTEAEAIDQEYLSVKEKLDDVKAKLATKQSDVKAQTAKVAAMRQIVGQVALARFQNRSLDTAAQIFFTSDTDGFLNQISTVEKVSENQNATLQDYQASQAALADLERSAETDVATLKAQQQELSRLRTSSDKKLTDSKAVLAKLTQQQQDLIASQDAQDSLDATEGVPVGDIKASGRGAVALAFAKRQLGKPYRFGATGPGAYDCSGLTGAAWRAAGVSLPRTSQAQFHVGRAVSRADLQPGDLVFFYGGISHVALYVGNGIILHAPRPGSSVTYTKLAYMPYAGARRPG